MELWINRLLMGGGSVSGLMLGSGCGLEGTALAAATFFGVVLLRMQTDTATKGR